MSYALVLNSTIQSEGGLPSAAKRIDTGQWVMFIPTTPVSLQQACGWFQVTDVARPADTASVTYDRSLTLVAGVPTVTWTQRAKTQAELDGDTANTNRSAIVTNLTSDMAAMQTLIGTANATINANPAQYLKDVARMLRRLGRQALTDYTGST